MLDKDFNKEFKKCPACGSESRFFESLTEEARERGMVRKEFTMFLESKQGVIVDPQKIQGLLIGAELIGFVFAEDFCAECGCRYATKLMRLKVHKTLDKAKPAPMPPSAIEKLMRGS